MGYTHYWYQPVGSEIPPDVWARIGKDVTTLLAASPCTLAVEYDQPQVPPEIDASCIRFNGVGDDGHETFLLTRTAGDQVDWRRDEPEVFTFCKTARKPYDLVVCAVLAVVHDHAGEALIRVGSDGEAEDWRKPLRFVAQTLNRKVPLPLPTPSP